MKTEIYSYMKSKTNLLEMKTLIIISLILFILKILCVTSSLVSPSRVGQTREDCFSSLYENIARCVRDTCLRINCNNNSIKTTCNIEWDQLCCIEFVSAKQCSPQELKIINKGHKKIQKILESKECKDYPRCSYKCKKSY
jgi:hypothetical protein